MCKVLMFTNFNKIDDVEYTINTIFKHITKRDDDGFGYAFHNKNGVFGERTTNKTWKFGSKSYPFLDFTSVGNSFGVPNFDEIQGPALFHGRTSTNHATLLNTHPIVKHDWALIHNGVVTNRGPEHEMITTNDSEHVLHYLVNEGIKGLEKHLTGYYAVGAIDPNGMLHVIRDDKAGLCGVYSPDLESYVLGTTQDLVKSVLDDLGVSYETIQEYDKNTYCIFKGNTLVNMMKFKPRGYDTYESSMMSKSLHYLNDDGWSRNPTSYFDDIPSAKNEKSGTEAFFEEAAFIDDSYQISDWNGREIDATEFHKLDNIGKANCFIIRPDGTIMDHDNYYEEKLA